MKTGDIRTSQDTDLYRELFSAMNVHREYENCHIMQYQERQETAGMVAIFVLREAQ